MSVGQQAFEPAILAPLVGDLHAALAASRTGTWRWDANTGEVRWDSTLEELCGLEPGSFGRTFDDWLATLHPDEVASIMAELNHALEHRSAYHFEHRVIWPDGTIRWLEVRGQVTVDGDGEFTGTVGCVVDITERKEAEVSRERALERERRIRDRIEFLSGLSATAVSAADHHSFMRSVCASAVPKLGDWCSIHFIAEPGAEVEVEVAHVDPAKTVWAEQLLARHPYDPAGRQGVAQAVRTGRTEFIERVTPEVVADAIAQSAIDPLEAQQILDELGVTSVITVPLWSKRGVLGAVRFVSAESGRIYDADDVALAEATAGRIADALNDLWVTEQHHRISVILQDALLPGAVPAIPGAQVAVRYWPAGHASEVGGDFYDVFEVADNRWALLIGDVCGTGPEAAALTGLTRHTARAAAQHGQNHRAVLEWCNDALRQSNDGRFCTAVYATLDISGGRTRLTSVAAGHPLPVLVRADGTAEMLGCHGTLLGVFDDLAVTEASIDLSPGDVVVLYTDGLYDLPPPHEISPEEVVRLIAGGAGAGSAEEVADAIHYAMAERLPFDKSSDDVAVIVIRVET